MGKIFQIAKNTFRESIRDKVLYVIAFFAAVMMLASLAFGWISIGDQLQVVQDFSLAVLSFFGALMAVFIGAGLIHKEIDKRTIYTIISKPVQRWQFLLGKYLGLLAVLGLAMIGMLAASLAFVAYAAWTAKNPAIPIWTERVAWGWYAVAMLMIFFETMVVVSLAMLFGSVTSPILSAIFTFTAYLVGQVSASINYMFTTFVPAKESVARQTGEILTDLASQLYFLLKPLSLLIYYLLPDLSYFQLRNQVVLGPPPTGEQIFTGMLYGAGYSLAALILAVILFDRKRF
ncbi:MAG: ABC transporter permease [Planctomycetota bacterium]|jgi:ABC-type transport system involved in multi-copper enzyme maturation permease subunit|nr:ABC transporter permease [Planctomycetota bacterium]